MEYHVQALQHLQDGLAKLDRMHAKLWEVPFLQQLQELEGVQRSSTDPGKPAFKACPAYLLTRLLQRPGSAWQPVKRSSGEVRQLQPEPACQSGGRL